MDDASLDIEGLKWKKHHCCKGLFKLFIPKVILGGFHSNCQVVLFNFEN